MHLTLQKKSKKARNAQETSGIIEQVGAIDASNVLVVCPACGKGTRVHHAEVDGKKVRVCAKCGASLDAAAKAPKATAKTATKTTKATKETKEPKAKKEPKTKKTAKAE